jgi:hypothetical protein
MPNMYKGMKIDRAAMIARNKWLIQYVGPFSIAYNDAYKKYSEVVNADKAAAAKAREEKAALVMLALTVCGGSILTATIGAAALKTGLGQAALNTLHGPVMDYIVKKDSMRLYKAAEFASSSATLHFILGSAYDKASADLTLQFKTLLTNAPVSASIDQIVKDPDNLKTQLEVYVAQLHNKIILAAEAIEKSSAENKDELLEKLKEAPFFSKIPDIRRSQGRMRENIELTFWMNHVLSRDFLVHKTSFHARDGHHTESETWQPINKSPSDSSYPKAHNPGTWAYDRHTQGHGKTESYLGYRDTGDLIDARVNELYERYFKVKFFANDTWRDKKKHYSAADLDGRSIRRAEATIRKLHETQALAIAGAR